MFKTLHKFNFGETFIQIQYAKTMYNNIDATVLNNGNTSKLFKPQRGVQQGCPLSAHRFITALENFGHKK